jgi:hypothetical protein
LVVRDRVNLRAQTLRVNAQVAINEFEKTNVMT